MALGMEEETALLRYVLLALVFGKESAFNFHFRFLIRHMLWLLGLPILAVVALLQITLAVAIRGSGRTSRCLLGLATIELQLLVLTKRQCFFVCLRV